MKLLRQLLAGLSIVAMLSGCASSGTKFSRLEEDKFELGKTTYQEIRVQLGTPTSERSDTWNGLELYQISYIFATAGSHFDALYNGIVATRMQRFWFREGILYGYQFSSSFKSDNSQFDDDRLAEIRNGVSTRADVISLLGPLTGRFIYPISLEKGGERLAYVYFHVEALPPKKQYGKKVSIDLDANGTVVKVDFNEAGESAAPPILFNVPP